MEKNNHKKHSSGPEKQHHDHRHHHKMMVQDFKRRFYISLLFSIPVIVLSPLVQKTLGFSLSFFGDKYLLFLFSTAIFFYGGWPFLRGLVSELKKKQPGMMTLIGLAISVAFFYSSAVIFGISGKVFFWELVTLIDIMLLGHWIEMSSVLGASKALESLAKLIPSRAHLIGEGGTIEDVPVSELKVGDKVLIKPGENIPSDGEIIEGRSNVNEAMLTGESTPVTKQTEDKVIGGSINGEGSLRVKIKHTGKDSYISQVVNLVEKAQKSKSKTQNLANKAAFWLTIISITTGIVTLFVWIYLGREFVFSLERMVTVMVITCPHALGLAIPLVVAVSTSISAKKGLLIRNRTAFERARDIDAVIFDKTGTLTKGEFGVSNIISFENYSEKEVLFYAASLENNSEHPIAEGIVKKAKEKEIELKSAQNFQTIPGEGVEGKIKGELIKAVGKNYLKEKEIKINNRKIKELSEQGKTITYILKEGKLIGVIALFDLLREESKQAIIDLKKMGIECLMLTGDNRKVAETVAEELGLDNFFAEVLPDEKSEVVKKVKKEKRRVAMVGDGINDAPALVEADIGIAIGAGTDVAIESADVVLVKSDPRDVVSIISLARSTYSKMKQNLFWATGYNIVAIPLAAGVFYNLGIVLSPAVGAILMSLSTVIVAVNATFLKIKR